MSYYVKSIRRLFASSLLVLLQLHLLGVATLHQHGETPTLRQAPAITQSDVQSSTAGDSNLLCTACQIVHNGAAQPGSAAQVLPASTTITLVRRMTPNHYRSELPAMSYGRAPPLA